MSGVFDEPTARRMVRAALAQDRCADLLNCLEAGGAVTVDARTGALICIAANALLALSEGSD